MITTAIFDLDGTLADTLYDLAVAEIFGIDCEEDINRRINLK